MKYDFCQYYIEVCKNFISYINFIKFKLENKLPLTNDDWDLLNILCERIENDEE